MFVKIVNYCMQRLEAFTKNYKKETGPTYVLIYKQVLKYNKKSKVPLLLTSL